MRIRRLSAALVISGFVSGCGDALAPADLVEVRLEIAGGDDQETVSPAGSLITNPPDLADSLRVRVMDQYGEPLAGRTVTWSATTGSVSPASVQTDASGMAAVSWRLHGPSSGRTPAGSYIASASTSGAEAVDFAGHVRAGVKIHSVAFTPDPVDVGSGDAPVTVAVHLTDDRRDAHPTHVSVQLYNPSATQTSFESLTAQLELDSGTWRDGEWRGALTIPADAERGAWTLGRLTVGWGCGPTNRFQIFDSKLAELELTHHLHVTGAPVSDASQAEKGRSAPAASPLLDHSPPAC